MVAGINESYGLQLGMLKDISKEKLRGVVSETKQKLQETKEKNKGVKQYDAYSHKEVMVAPTEANVAALERQLMLLEMTGEQGTKTYKNIKEKADEMRRQLNENNAATNEYIEALAQLKMVEWFPEGTIENAEDLEEVLAKISVGNFSFSEGLLKISENLGLTGQELELFKTIISGLIKEEYPDFNAQTELAGGNLKYLDQVIGIHLTTLQGYADKYAILRTAQDEYNKTGEMTISTLQNLINNDLLQYLTIQDGKLKITAQDMLNMAEASKVAAIESLKDAAAKDIEKLAIGDVDSMSNIAKGALAQFAEKEKQAGNEATTSSAKILELAASIDTAAKAGEGKLGEGIDLETFKKQAEAIKSAYMGIAKNISSINITSAAYKPQQVNRTGTDSAEYQAQKAAEAAKKAEEEAYKARLKQFTDYMDEKERLEKRWVDKQKELGQLSNEDYMYITQQRIERYKKYLEEIKKATWMAEEDRLKLVKEYSEKIEDAQVDYIGYLQDQLEDEIKALEDANEEKIKLIEEEADARIAALDKVTEATDRAREKENYDNERQSILEEISYWEQRTGREAQEALLEAKKKLAELDAEWEDTQEDWSVEDQIKAIQGEADAQIAAIESAQDAEIKAMQELYDAKVKMFVETVEIIYEGIVIQAQSLYNAYKANFIDPISAELANLNKATTNTAAPTQQQQQQYETYTIKAGDTLSKIARSFGTTVDKIMAANPYITNKNRIYAGKTLQIPKFHEGGIVGGNQEAFALLKPNEVILKTEWAASLNRMMKYFDNVTTGKTNGFTNNPVIEVKGNLIQIDADIKSKSDVDYLERRIEKMLKSKFNIKK